MANKILANKYFLLVSRVLLGFIFIYAGIEKAANPAEFAGAINNYKLLPFPLINIAALTLPWTEIITGVFLIFGIAVKENSFIISSLLGIFFTAVIVSLFRGLNIDCGCFGTSGGSTIGIKKLVENAFLILLGIQLIYFGGGEISLGQHEDQKKSQTGEVY